MVLTQWQPLKEIEALQRRMGRLFHDPFLSAVFEDEAREVEWAPRVDVFEDGQAYVVKVELPEVDMKDVDIQIEDHTLRVKGTRKLEHDEKREDYHRLERAYGAFTRTFSLPQTVDAEKIQASYDKGVLRITLPKKPESQPRKIAVSAG